MTERHDLDDPYQQSITATVERVHEDRVVLDRTVFYPTGGGQPHDTGTLTTPSKEWRVTDVQKRDAIYHALDGTPPEPGTTVTASIDWDRRFAHMRYHTAQHLLSALLLDAYDAPTRGNQLSETGARLDCAHDRFSRDDLAAIEARLTDLIQADLPVEWYVLDRETAEATLDAERTRLELLPDSITDVRIVEIGDVDRTACAGTHVDRTGEIGALTLSGRETGGEGRERLRFELDH